MKECPDKLGEVWRDIFRLLRDELAETLIDWALQIIPRKDWIWQRLTWAVHEYARDRVEQEREESSK